MSHRVPRAVVLAAAAVLAMISASPSFASAASTATTVRHCIAEPAAAGETAPAMQCFSTFAAAISAATNGRVQLSQATAAGAVTPDELNAGASPLTSVVIGIDYTGTSFTGSSLTWFQSAACGSYTASSMPTGWNDVISSAATYSGCGSTLYQNINFGGTTSSVGVNASKSTLGTFNGQASSQKWCTSSSC
jgi:hypothetical protein